MRSTRTVDNPIQVSLVIPCHNACPELNRTIQSILNQSLDKTKIEALLIDDGSTDDTWPVIQAAINNHPDLFKAEKIMAPSGSPAFPRNIGLSMARGEYIFCLDSDDWLGEEALERMINHAHKWDSDVMYVKLASEGGREVAKSMFTANCESVDVFHSNIFWSLAPFKLIRRSLIEENNIRFSEKGMPEDVLFVLKACILARKVSVASDYDYYYYYQRPDGQGTVNRVWSDTSVNIPAYQEIFAFIDSTSTPEQRNATLMRRLFKRDFFEMMVHCSKESGVKASKDLESLTILIGTHYSGVRERLGFRYRMVLDAGMTGDLNKLKRTVHFATGFFFNRILVPLSKPLGSALRKIRK